MASRSFPMDPYTRRKRNPALCDRTPDITIVHEGKPRLVTRNEFCTIYARRYTYGGTIETNEEHRTRVETTRARLI